MPRSWLNERNIDYVFHDYKKQGVNTKDLKNWAAQLGWETLLNQRGTTWRSLDEKLKASINQSSALKIMQDNPSIIKRPILDVNGKYFVGFSEEAYNKIKFK